MPKFRENRPTLLYAHYNGVISDEEFVLLYDINTAKSPDLPYWNYDPFDLDEMSDDECKCEFRFLRNDVYRLTLSDLGGGGFRPPPSYIFIYTFFRVC